MKIVLEVMSHSTEQVNKRQFEHYKLKVLEADKVYVTEGFAQAGVKIEPRDVIENMSVVKRLSCSELCRTFYEAKAIEEKTKKSSQVIKTSEPVIRIAQVIRKKVEVVHKQEVEQMSLF